MSPAFEESAINWTRPLEVRSYQIMALSSKDSNPYVSGPSWRVRPLPQGTQEQDVTISTLSEPMDHNFSAGEISSKHVAATTVGHDLTRTQSIFRSSNLTPTAGGSISHIPGSGHLVFNSSMEPVAPKTLGPRSRADKDAALHLKRAGGACPRHKASKKRVSQWLRDYWLALMSSKVSL